MTISKTTFKTLKLFYENVSISNEEVDKLPKEAISTLEKYELITRDFLGYLDGQHKTYTLYHITDAGKAYVQNHSKIIWLKQNWISLLSMIFAFIAAVPVIWKAIAYILQHIM